MLLIQIGKLRPRGTGDFFSSHPPVKKNSRGRPQGSLSRNGHGGRSWVASKMWDPEVGTWGLQLEALGKGGCQSNKEVLL